MRQHELTSRPAVWTEARQRKKSFKAMTLEPCYESFKKHLVTRGFTVYPSEFDCIYSEHPMVDIAAKMGSFYWAFEYKSENDSVSRGVEQLQCYLEWFDYVVLVSERTFDHRSSANYWELKDMGAGLWFYDPQQDKCIQRTNPGIQNPHKYNRRSVTRKFRTVAKNQRGHTIKESDSTRQLDLFSFVV
jgi:hypothetical protein